MWYLDRCCRTLSFFPLGSQLLQNYFVTTFLANISVDPEISLIPGPENGQAVLLTKCSSFSSLSSCSGKQQVCVCR